MSDSEPAYIGDDSERPEPDSRQSNDRRSLVSILAVVVVVVVIVLGLLMMRGCGSVMNNANKTGGKNEIAPVEGRTPVDGAISLWVKAGTSAQQVVSAAGIASQGIVDMGGGRYVVDLAPGTEVESARRLKDADGVYDAGRVYEGDAATK